MDHASLDMRQARLATSRKKNGKKYQSIVWTIRHVDNFTVFIRLVASLAPSLCRPICFIALVQYALTPKHTHIILKAVFKRGQCSHLL